MKQLFFFLVATAIVSCAQTQGKEIKIPVGSTKPVAGEAMASFAEGCFWHAEIVFQSLEGVRDAVSGYAGGNSKDPSYDNLGEGATGHAETVIVYYDPKKISFTTLVRAFFASHDPTQVNRQGNDVGSQYRSIAFYRNDEEKKIIESEIVRLKASKKYNRPLATEVKQLEHFYPAEEYHQEYISHNPGNSYVRFVSIPDYERFLREFKEGKFKS
jgi:peptide-methionine (S)-S-oxide reductase